MALLSLPVCVAIGIVGFAARAGGGLKRVLAWSALAISLVAGVGAMPALFEPLIGHSRLNIALQGAAGHVVVCALAIGIARLRGRQAGRLITLAACLAWSLDFPAYFVMVLLLAGWKGQARVLDVEEAVGWRRIVLAAGAATVAATGGEIALRFLLAAGLGPMMAYQLNWLPTLETRDAWRLLGANSLATTTVAAFLLAVERRWRGLVSGAMVRSLFTYLCLSRFVYVCCGEAIAQVAIIVLLWAMADVSLKLATAAAPIRRRTLWGTELAAATSVALLALESKSPGTTQLSKDDAKANVILVTLDTVRADRMSLYGNTRSTTPFLDELATQSVVFEQAYTPAPWTLPAHASMLTGRLPHETGADYTTGLDPGIPTLAEALAARGYETAGFVANLSNCGRHTGLARGFQSYSERPPLTKALWSYGLLASWRFSSILPYLRTDASELNAVFFDWMDHRFQVPFFAFLNYMDVHEPYRVPDPAFDRFSSMPAFDKWRLRQRWDCVSIDEWEFQSGDAERQLAIETYDGALAYLDDQLRRLVEGLRHRGELDRTLLVITSDHGEHFGEKGLFNHARSLYRPLIAAPLLLHFPGRVPTGVRRATPVTLTDLPASVLDLLEFQPDPAFPAATWRKVWSDDRDDTVVRPILAELTRTPQRPDWPNGRGSLRSLVQGNSHYIRNLGTGEEELYDLSADPLETANLANDPAAARRLEDLRALCDRHYGPASAAKTGANAADDRPESSLSVRGRSLAFNLALGAICPCCPPLARKEWTRAK